ncbi:MAG: extracellular solute-binding protein [Desulfobacterales bacterium]|nr:extracellular solute-binding protein [Desulfobacterales bacterium]
MNRSKWTSFFIFLALWLVFLAQPEVAPASAWDELVAKAKGEGKLVVSTSHSPATRGVISKGFKEAFGIEMEFIAGTGGTRVRKLLSERQAAIYAQDIFMGGTTSILTRLKPAGALDPIEPAMMLPGVLDKKLWIGGDYFWADRDRTVLVFMLMAGPGQSSIYNSTMVKPGEIKVYDDLLDPKWKGKILMFDPTKPGPGQRFVGVTAEKIKGWDYMEKLAKQDLTIATDRRLAVEWVTRGKYAIGLGNQTGLPLEYIKAGAPILEFLPDDDIATSGGPNNLALINRAPHPAAAKVFVNWLLDKQGQTILSESTAMASVKTDVATDHISPVRRLDPGKKYFLVDHEDYILKEPEYLKKTKKIFGPLLK